MLFEGDLATKQENESKVNYKLNYEVPQLSSYQQVKEETKLKSRQTGSSEGEETNDSKLPQISKPSTENSKVVITGDDVLIEYVTRLILKIKSIEETQLSQAESV